MLRRPLARRRPFSIHAGDGSLLSFFSQASYAATPASTSPYSAGLNQIFFPVVQRSSNFLKNAFRSGVSRFCFSSSSPITVLRRGCVFLPRYWLAFASDGSFLRIAEWICSAMFFHEGDLSCPADSASLIIARRRPTSAPSISGDTRVHHCSAVSLFFPPPVPPSEPPPIITATTTPTTTTRTPPIRSGVFEPPPAAGADGMRRFVRLISGPSSAVLGLNTGPSASDFLTAVGCSPATRIAPQLKQANFVPSSIFVMLSRDPHWVQRCVRLLMLTFRLSRRPRVVAAPSPSRQRSRRPSRNP